MYRVMISKELIAASSEALVLSILESGQNYGYEILRLVRESSNQRIQWSDGMLYPVLHRLEKRELLESSWSTSESGRRRKYYCLKTKGHDALKTQKEQWEIVNSTLNTIWAT